MRVVAAVLSMTAWHFPSGLAAEPELIGRQTASDNYIQICPNPEYEGLNETVTCMNITNPTAPKGYGGRTCVSLTYTPLRVGSPQGISSCRMFGIMNCTLYKTEDCLPDTRENGFVIPASGSRSLPQANYPDDPYAFDDKTVAFNCRPLQNNSSILANS